MGTLGARKLQREKTDRHFLVQLSVFTSHERMIAGCKFNKKIAKISAAAITQPSYILNAGQRIVSIASCCEKLLAHYTAKEGTRDFCMHHVVRDFICSGQCGIRVHGDFSGHWQRLRSACS